MPLVHEYNAAQRRAYYLRTRKLKGRHPGTQPISAATRLKVANAKKAKKRQELKMRVDALQARLEQLRKVLAVLVDKAQAKNGNSSKKESDKKSTIPEHQTAKQKAAAKKASEKYAKTHKAEVDQTLSERAKSLTAKIKTIEERIKKLRAKN